MTRMADKVARKRQGGDEEEGASVRGGTNWGGLKAGKGLYTSIHFRDGDRGVNVLVELIAITISPEGVGHL